MIDNFPWLDGFDYYATDYLDYKWASSTNIHVSPTGGRRNGGCIVPTGAGEIVSPDFDLYNDTEATNSPMGISMAIRRGTTDEFSVVMQSAGDVTEAEFKFLCSGRVACRAAGGSWFYTSGIVPIAEWCVVKLFSEGYQADLSVSVLDSAGNELLTEIFYPSPGGSGAPMTHLRIEAATCGNWQIDDVVIHNAVFKDLFMLGDCRIDAMEMLIDDADNCEYVEWTLSSGIEDFATVLLQPEETATSVGPGANFACITTGVPHDPVSIYAVQANAWLANTDGAGFKFRTLFSDEQVTGRMAADAAETGYRHSWIANPSTAEDWVRDDVNGTSFGIRSEDAA